MTRLSTRTGKPLATSRLPTAVRVVPCRTKPTPPGDPCVGLCTSGGAAPAVMGLEIIGDYADPQLPRCGGAGLDPFTCVDEPPFDIPQDPDDGCFWGTLRTDWCLGEFLGAAFGVELFNDFGNTALSVAVTFVHVFGQESHFWLANLGAVGTVDCLAIDFTFDRTHYVDQGSDPSVLCPGFENVSIRVRAGGVSFLTSLPPGVDRWLRGSE